MKPRIYIAGKITGLPMEEVKAKFNKAETRLNDMEFTAINPTRIVPASLYNDNGWKRAMIICIEELMKCDAICLLSDWETSKGARIERHIAGELGLNTIMLEQE